MRFPLLTDFSFGGRQGVARYAPCYPQQSSHSAPAPESFTGQAQRTSSSHSVKLGPIVRASLSLPTPGAYGEKEYYIVCAACRCSYGGIV
jgi:hypothetical protein